jgi:hypothetical protein
VVSDDWLDAALRGDVDEEAAEAEPALPAPGEELPDWLSGAQPQARIADSETPDWLREPIEPTEPGEAPAIDEDMPDWLQAVTTTAQTGGLPSAPAEADAEPDADAEAQPESVPEPSADAPDWLADAMQADELPSFDDDVPDWLAAVSSKVDTGVLSPLPSLEEMGEDADAGVESEAYPEAATPAFDFEELAQGLTGEDVPDWLRAMQPAGVDVPQEAPSAPEPGGTVAPFEGSLEDLLQEEEAPIEAAISAQDVDTSVDAEGPLEETVDLEGVDLPGWLRDLRATEDGMITAEVAPAGTFPDEIPEEMESLRASTIPGALDPKVDLREESVGPLKGVVGVVAPSPVFSTLPPSAASTDAMGVDSAQISLMEGLLTEEDAGIPRADVARSLAAPLGRLLVALLLLVAIGLPIVGGMLPFDAPTNIDLAAADAARSLAGLGAESSVLLAFEYDPSQAGELSAEAEVLIETLMEREVTLYAVSTQPTGPVLAQVVLEDLAAEHGYAYGDGYLNLGYVPGRATGVRGLVTGVTRGTVSPLAFDFQGTPTDLGNARLADLEIDVIVLLAGTPESVRIWVEQAANPSGIPMVAAVSAGAEPMTLPYYRQGRQLEGVLSGLSGATRLTLATGDATLPPALNARWNAQVAGALATGLVIVAGIVYGAIGIGVPRRGQERP